jgi:hypothetical protein
MLAEKSGGGFCAQVRERELLASLVGRKLGSALRRVLMKFLASSLTPPQYRVWKTTRSLRHSSMRSPMDSLRKGE